MDASSQHSPTDLIRLLRNESLAALVEREIERSILAGEYEANQKLKEEEIAERLSVSRGPVREAFRTLTQAGLVRMEKNKGVTVRQISVAEAGEIYELRAGLDYLVGMLAAQRISQEQLDKAAALVDAMGDAAQARDVDAYYPMNFEYHDLLVVSTGNQALIRTYRQTVKKIHLFRRHTLAAVPASFPTSIREHRLILDALSRRDSAQAARLLYEHTIESWQRLQHIVAPVKAQ